MTTGASSAARSPARTSRPPGTIVAGWWRADGSGFCDLNGPQPRYYLDCNFTCDEGCRCSSGGLCARSCTSAVCKCHGGCDTRKSECTRFRYGQCNQDLCVGPLHCRIVTCVPPWKWDPACATSPVLYSQSTRFHDRPCLHDGFTDIPPKALYAGAVEWMAGEGIAAGFTDDLFGPDELVSRGQFATFLWRYSGEPLALNTDGFDDVDPGAYYAHAVAWMVENAITAGRAPDRFDPSQQREPGAGRRLLASLGRGAAGRWSDRVLRRGRGCVVPRRAGLGDREGHRLVDRSRPLRRRPADQPLRCRVAASPLPPPDCGPAGAGAGGPAAGRSDARHPGGGPMTVVVVLLAVAVGVLALIVFGLLRTHAEILAGPRPGRDRPRRGVRSLVAAFPRSGPRRRRLRSGRAPQTPGIWPAPCRRAAPPRLRSPAWRTTRCWRSCRRGCRTCKPFWQAFADPGVDLPGNGTRLVIVGQDPAHDSESALAELVPPGVKAVLSSAAWQDYDVPGSPYFSRSSTVPTDGSLERAAPWAGSNCASCCRRRWTTPNWPAAPGGGRGRRLAAPAGAGPAGPTMLFDRLAWARAIRVSTPEDPLPVHGNGADSSDRRVE